MKKRSLLRTAALAAALSLLLSLLSACSGGGPEATAMRLRRTEGTVGVFDGDGKSLKPAEDLGLYGGYRVDTQIDGGIAGFSNSTAEGDVYVSAAYFDDGGYLFTQFDFTKSRAAKNIYVRNSAGVVSDSMVEGYIDVNNEERNSVYWTNIEKSTVNGQWYEKAAVVYEFQEGVWYDRDDVTVIVGRTP